MKYLCCVPTSMPGTSTLIGLVNDGAVETPHFGGRRDFVHPDAGKVRLAIGGAAPERRGSVCRPSAGASRVWESSAIVRGQ